MRCFGKTDRKYILSAITFIFFASVCTAKELVLPIEFRTHVTDLCAETLSIQDNAFREEDFFKLAKLLYDPVVKEVCLLSTEKVIIFYRRVLWAQRVGDFKRLADALEGMLNEQAITHELELQSRVALAGTLIGLKRSDEVELQIKEIKIRFTEKEKEQYIYELMLFESGLNALREKFDAATLIANDILLRIERTGEYPSEVQTFNAALGLSKDSGANIEPKLFHAPKPVYPWYANNDKTPGKVLVQFSIDEGGRVTFVEVIDEEPIEKGFGEAALEAARRQVFFPQVINGVALPASGLKTRYTFKPEFESPFSD